jgi:hypothetical protein
VLDDLKRDGRILQRAFRADASIDLFRQELMSQVHQHLSFRSSGVYAQDTFPAAVSTCLALPCDRSHKVVRVLGCIRERKTVAQVEPNLTVVRVFPQGWRILG